MQLKLWNKKKLIKKIAGENDSRSYTIQLSPAGKRIVAESENFALPVSDAIAKSTPAEKLILWDNITRMILQLNRLGVISVQRTCFNCRFHTTKDGDHYCNLLQKRLKVTDIRIDCNEFEMAQ